MTDLIVQVKDKIFVGDCLDVLKNIPSNTIDLVLTSPPYFQQRDYGNGDISLGNEKNVSEYLENLCLVFQECMRVTSEKGILVFNLGDKYINGNLSLLPYKFAIRVLENFNVSLVNQLNWIKLNPTPRQDKRKLIQSTEPFFIFVKSKDYTFNLEAYLQHLDQISKSTHSKPTEKIGQQYFEMIKKSDLSYEEKSNAEKSLNNAIIEVKNGEIEGFRMKIRGIHKLAYGGLEGGRNNQIKFNGFSIIKLHGNRMKKDIIESPVEITKNNEHPAVYPLYIIQELIKLLTNECDLVLDPFCGSGTTCVAAKILNRHYIGIEINSAYAQLAQVRVNQTIFNQQELFV